jgi:hypothetical protein
MGATAALVLLLSPATVSEQWTGPKFTVDAVGVALANAAVLGGQLLP